MVCSRLKVEAIWKEHFTETTRRCMASVQQFAPKATFPWQVGHIYDINGSGGSDFAIGRRMSCKNFTRNIFQVSNFSFWGSLNTLAGVWLLLSSDLHLRLSRIETNGKRMNCVILCRSSVEKMKKTWNQLPPLFLSLLLQPLGHSHLPLCQHLANAKGTNTRPFQSVERNFSFL